jgi:FkbM family methyltransferase
MEYQEVFDKYLNFRGGFFIEAGANNGLDQSNTTFLEQAFGWTGLLIEPNPHKFRECVANRPNCICENFALVSDSYNAKTIEGDFNHTDYQSLMGVVTDLGDFYDSHLVEAKEVRKNLYGTIPVPVATLTSLLNKNNITKIDLLSLDVEGYEISVLNGFDLNLYRPTYCLIETCYNFNGGIRQVAVTDHMVKNGYEMIANVGNADTLYRDTKTKMR